MKLTPKTKIDKPMRQEIRKVIQAALGDITEEGPGRADGVIARLARDGVVTEALAMFVDKAARMLVRRCDRCLVEGSDGVRCADCVARDAEPEHELPPGSGVLDRIDRYGLERACASKKRYGDEKTARRVAERCYQERGARLRVYACVDVCGGYHLTSQLERRSPESA